MSYSNFLKQPKIYTIDGFNNIMSESLYWNTNPDDFNPDLFSAISDNLVVDWYDEEETCIAKAKVVMTDSKNTFKLNDRVFILKECLVINYKWTKFDEFEKGKRISNSYYIVNQSDCYRTYIECDKISRNNLSLYNSKISKVSATTIVETREAELKTATEIKIILCDYIDPPYYSDDSGDLLLEDDITVCEPEYWTDDDYEALPQNESRSKTASAPTNEKPKRERIPLDEFKKRMDTVREKERQIGVPEWQIKAVDYLATLTSKGGKYRFPVDKASAEVLKKYPQLKTTDELSKLIQARRGRMKGV